MTRDETFINNSAVPPNFPIKDTHYSLTRLYGSSYTLSRWKPIHFTLDKFQKTGSGGKFNYFLNVRGLPAAGLLSLYETSNLLNTINAFIFSLLNPYFNECFLFCQCKKLKSYGLSVFLSPFLQKTLSSAPKNKIFMATKSQNNVIITVVKLP